MANEKNLITNFFLHLVPSSATYIICQINADGNPFIIHSSKRNDFAMLLVLILGEVHKQKTVSYLFWSPPTEIYFLPFY